VAPLDEWDYTFISGVVGTLSAVSVLVSNVKFNICAIEDYSFCFRAQLFPRGVEVYAGFFG
jgi:hypothetical protein